MSNVFAKLLQESEHQHYQVQQSSSSEKPETNEAVVFSPSDSTTARQHAVLTNRQSDSKLSRQHDSTSRQLQSFLQAKATQKTTLRYSPSLMEEIDDVLYQIKKTYGVALSKNEIFVLGLAYILFDFRQNANHSILTRELFTTSK